MTQNSNCEKAEITTLGKMVVVRTERGGKAIVGLHNLCSIAKKLNLCIENYKC